MLHRGGRGDGIGETTSDSPLDRQVLPVPFSAGTKLCNNLFLEVMRSVLHIAPRLLLKKLLKHDLGSLQCLCTYLKPASCFHNSKSSTYFTAPSELSYLPDVLIQAFQISPTQLKGIGVFLTAPRFTVTERGRCCVMEPGTSTNAQNVSLSVIIL